MSNYIAAGASDPGGAGPAVTGDPLVALLAQLNRFAGKTLTPPGGTSRRYVSAPFALAVTAYDQRAATSALTILVDRYQYAPTSSYDKAKVTWAMSGYDNPVPFVAANLDVIVPVIAQYGDSLGLDTAVVGITTRDPKFTPSISLLMVGTLALGAWFVFKGKR